MKKRKTNYINNKELYAEMIKYKELLVDAENSGEEKPAVPEYICLAIYKISNQLANKPNFYNYSYKDEMILDGIENCIRYCHNFDPEKYDNPFAYLTTIIYQAFLRRIAKEKKQAQVKVKMMEHSLLFDLMVEQSEENHLHFNGSNILSNDTDLNSQFFDESRKAPSKKKIQKKKKLELFIDEGEE